MKTFKLVIKDSSNKTVFDIYDNCTIEGLKNTLLQLNSYRPGLSRLIFTKGETVLLLTDQW